MFRLFASGFALAVLALTGPVSADDKKDKEKFTVWTREINGIDLKFEMGKTTAKYHVHSGDNVCVVTSKVKYDKDTVTSEVTDVDVKGEFPNAPKKGEKISFKWVVKDEVATLSDLTGDGTENAKNVIESEYKLKK
ncbi:hypothetical protein [Frigoriglobus tundricola]|uniref:Uncharacterized protein n=1 Tax=Frigoriglobus tundricola TaxID=2774151 RepID=A0A6M5YJI3_9BACT|nr:hypothetical protein [Frigoriglobus tundricola]QJW93426.1 hypothetical protein FTUN_0932 [Frigoriglobus tundricola]